MLIVIEGCDGTGKTTLAGRLKEYLPGTTSVRHCAQLQRHPLDEYEQDLDGYLPGTDKHLVYDRFHLGELIYGPLYRNGSKLDPEMLWHVEAYLNSRGAVLVQLRNDPAELAERLRRDKEDYLQPKHVGRVALEFDRVVDESCIEYKFIDHWALNETAHERIAKSAASADAGVLPLRPYTTYVGRCEPDILLLGERRGTPLSPASYAAAFVPHKATSGHYLIGALPEEVRPYVGLANALEEDVRSLWDALGGPQVVALGRKAHAEVSRADVPHGVVPHPQYVRRFHHDRRNEYGELIMRAARNRFKWGEWPA